MACLNKSNSDNFLRWSKVAGDLTLAELQSGGVPSVCDNLVSEVPTSVTATLMTRCDIDLDWVGTANVYEIQRSSLPLTGFVTIDTTTATEYIDGGLTVGTYYYRVRGASGIPSAWSTIVSAIVPFDFENALAIDQNTAYVNLFTSGFQAENNRGYNLTFSIWVDTSELDLASTELTSLYYSTGTSDNELFALELYGNGNDTFSPQFRHRAVGNDPTINTERTTEQFAIAGWHLIQYTFDENDPRGAKLYVDGSPIAWDGAAQYEVTNAENTFPSLMATATASMGFIYTTTGRKTTVDEFIVINDVITDADASAEWNGGDGYNELVTKYSADLIAHWQFNQGDPGGDNTSISAPEVLDASSNGYDGTMVNFSKTGEDSNWVEGKQFDGTGEVTLTLTPLSEEDILAEVVFPTFDSDWIAEISDDSGSTWTPSGTISSGTNYHVFSGLTGGDLYQVRVRKVDWTCYSESSESITYFDFGLALNTTNNGEYVRMDSGINSQNYPDDMVIAWWFKWTGGASGGGSNGAFVADFRFSGNGYLIPTMRYAVGTVGSFGLIAEGTNGVSSNVGSGTGNVAVFEDNEWHRVVWTKKESPDDSNDWRFTVTIDDTVISMGANDYQDQPKANFPPSFGDNYNELFANTFNGIEADIDEFIILDGDIIDQDITDDYNNGNGSNVFIEKYNAVVHYKFNKSGAIGGGNNTALDNVVVDSGGDGVDGTLNNFTKDGSTSNWVDGKETGEIENLTLTVLSATSIQIDITYPYGDVDMVIERSDDGGTVWNAITGSPVAGGTSSVTDTVTHAYNNTYKYRAQGDGMTGYFKSVYALEEANAKGWIGSMSGLTFTQISAINKYCGNNADNLALRDEFWILSLGETNSMIGMRGTVATNGGSLLDINGATFNGVDQFIDTNWVASTDATFFTQNDAMFEGFIKTANLGAAIEKSFGSDGGSGVCNIFSTGGALDGLINQNVADSLSAGNYVSDELLGLGRSSANDLLLRRDGVTDTSKVRASTGVPSISFHIGRANTTGTNRWFDGTISTFSVGAENGFNAADENTHLRQLLTDLGTI